VAEYVYLNGSLIPGSQARVSALDYGFLYGFGLFETMRSYEGKVFRLEKHLSRLEEGAKVLGLSVDRAELKSAVMDLIHANKLGEARIRITVSPGEGAVKAEPGTCIKATVLVTAEKYIPYQKKVYRKGLRAIVSSLHRNSRSPVSGLKSTSYLESILARREARVAGTDEAICLNERGLVAEASMSNVFVVSDGVLKTPGLESGILPGITRQAVLELASKIDITSCECDIGLDELLQAQEAFITSSLIEVMPLTRIDNRPIASGIPGAITGRLMAAYRELVVSEIGAV
jgi:branched-chain amino acid aminotransferase